MGRLNWVYVAATLPLLVHCGGRAFSEDSLAVGICGNGVIEAEEECDDGNQIGTDECSNRCEWARCGDGILHIGESCDHGDSNGKPFDSCTIGCEQTICGDGIAQTNEECDDGNSDPNDACSNSCTKNAGRL